MIPRPRHLLPLLFLVLARPNLRGFPLAAPRAAEGRGGRAARRRGPCTHQAPGGPCVRQSPLSPRATATGAAGYEGAHRGDGDGDELDRRLLAVARLLKLTRRRGGGGLRLESARSSHGLQVINASVSMAPDRGLGLVLEELYRSGTDGSGEEGCGLVLVREAEGAAAAAGVRPGDVIARASVPARGHSAPTTGFGYDRLVEVLAAAKQLALEAADGGAVELELHRLVERAHVQVGLDTGRVLDALAGDNLRLLLLRERIALGTCGGRGECGQCVVDVQVNGSAAATRQRACECILATDNQPATYHVSL